MPGRPALPITILFKKSCLKKNCPPPQNFYFFVMRCLLQIFENNERPQISANFTHYHTLDCYGFFKCMYVTTQYVAILLFQNRTSSSTMQYMIIQCIFFCSKLHIVINQRFRNPILKHPSFLKVNLSFFKVLLQTYDIMTIVCNSCY